MPELPEVETIRRGLAEFLTGRTVVGVQVLHPRPVRGHVGGEDDFAVTLTGRTFTTPARRGKYLWFPFVDGDALVAHLRMSGQFRLDPAGAPLARHTRVTFALDDARELRFVDQRMLGGLTLSAGGAALPSEVSHIARDLFDPELDLDATVAAVRRRTAPIKSVILNQRVVSGIGNIYADEALWLARVHYGTSAAALSEQSVRRLLHQARAVMTRSLAAGGTSFDALYVNVNGSSGYFSRSLNCYGREGDPCPRCGTTIARERFGGRSSYLCPGCQPPARLA